MTNPFDADDFFKRSIFSSILGFARKTKSTGTTSTLKNEVMNRAESGIYSGSAHPKYRTKQEIYDEIVCECAELEKNKAVLTSSTGQTRSATRATMDSMDMATILSHQDFDLTEHNTAMTIENIVRLVVTAVKKSEILKNGLNSPEDILKRRRMQNNEAAARYRRRQKELREEAELELTILVNKNNELKNDIKRMQAEIDHLKAQVLKQTNDKL